MSKQLVGLVGWRGMVGSVLMDRMQAEGELRLIEPVFFSTSNAGGKAPAMATVHTQLKDANDIAELSKCDIIITCQGGDYTKEVFPRSALPAGTATGSTRPPRCAWKTTPSSCWTPSTTT